MTKRTSSAKALDHSLAATEGVDRGLMVITAIVIVLTLLRCVVLIFPELYWDVDPRSQNAAQVITGLGPVGAAWLDMLSVLASAMALFMHGRAGGKLAWKSFVLALIGGGVCAWQMTQYGPGMITAGAWIAAMSLAVAAFHLAQHAGPRRLMTASLAAMAAPLLLRALVYVWWEHPLTLEMFLKNEAQSVAAHGWQMGSPQHILFKRRLMFPDVTGAFGLSNVYGSVVAAIGMIAAGLAAHLARQQQWKKALLPTALLLMTCWILYLTHSKGAVIAMLMGMGLLGLVILSWRWTKLRALVAPAVMLCIVLAIGLVIVRGMMGPPPTEQGERSLLFRYQYWQASMRMIQHESWPARLLGVGPGQYKDSYAFYKNPLNPEEVTSAHNVLLDLVTMLGVGGLAWGSLLLGWLWIAARAMARQSRDAPLQQAPPRALMSDRDVFMALAMAAGLFGVQAWTQGVTMLAAEQFLSWAMGATAFIGVIALLGTSRWTGWAAAQTALCLGAAVLLIHNQIEMSFYNNQASQVVYVIVAAAAGAGMGLMHREENFVRSPQKSDGGAEISSGLHLTGPAIGAVVLLLGAGFLLAAYVIPVTRQQGALAQAAELTRQGRIGPAMGALEKAIAALPRDPRPYDSKVMLQMEGASYFASQKQSAESQKFISSALVTLDQAYAAGLTDVSLDRRRAQVLENAAKMWGDSRRLTTAIHLWERVMVRSPYSLMDCLHLADLLWSTGELTQARQWYRRALQLNGENYLDSGKQLPAEQLRRVEDLLAAG